MVVHNYIHGRSAVNIVDGVEAAIRGERLAPGDPLPTVRALSAALGVSPATVASAYRTLRMRGVLLADGRRGTRVSGRPPLVSRPVIPFAPHVRNLADGNPDPRLLPPLERALSAIRTRAADLYAARSALPELVDLGRRSFHADGVPAAAITVVGGAMDGIERVLEAHLRPGDRIGVEDPGFTRVLDLVGALGLLPVPIALDEAGPLPEALDQALGARVRAVVVTPRAQNPTGAALDPRRARDLRRVLARHPDVLVVEDDHAGPVAGAPAVTLCDQHRRRWAIARSVSKWLGPDLRLAVIAGDPTTIARVEGRQLIGTGWVSHLLQRIVVALWSDRGAERRFRAAAEAYAARRTALLTALRSRGITALGRSGLNVWIPVAEEAETLRGLLDAGFGVAGGERFRLRSSPAIRVTTATLEHDEAERFAAALARTLAPARRTHPA